MKVKSKLIVVLDYQDVSYFDISQLKNLFEMSKSSFPGFLERIIALNLDLSLVMNDEKIRAELRKMIKTKRLAIVDKENLSGLFKLIQPVTCSYEYGGELEGNIFDINLTLEEMLYIDLKKVVTANNNKNPEFEK